MNYLFFDIECANCFNGTGKICEFGYILVDSNYNLIKKQEILINPQSGFDSYAIKNILHFTKNEYRSSPDFKELYEEIKSILTAENQMIFGHAIKNDAKFLKDDCKRYALPFIDFLFCDVGKIYQKQNNLKDTLKLEKMCNSFGMEEVPMHNAMCDAESTMFVLKNLCIQEGISPEGFIKKYPETYERLNFNEESKREKLKKLKLAKAQKAENQQENQ